MCQFEYKKLIRIYLHIRIYSRDSNLFLYSNMIRIYTSNIFEYSNIHLTFKRKLYFTLFIFTIMKFFAIFDFFLFVFATMKFFTVFVFFFHFFLFVHFFFVIISCFSSFPFFVSIFLSLLQD